MPKKPIKNGFKPYILCESKSSYALKWIMDVAEIK